MATHQAHILRHNIRLMHLFGLVSLQTYPEPWKNRLHSYYSKFVVTLLLAHLTSIVASVFVYSVKDVTEFAARSKEVMCVIASVTELFMIRARFKDFEEMIAMFEKLLWHHGRHRLVTRMNYNEKLALKICMTGILSGVAVIMTIPFLPKSQATLDFTQRIYHLKYPLHTFDIPLYIPYCDPSVPLLYAILYLTLIYVATLHCVNVISIYTLVVIPFYDMKVYTNILCEYASAIGGTHLDLEGRPVLYKDLRTNEFVVRNRVEVPNMEKSRSEAFVVEKESEVEVELNELNEIKAEKMDLKADAMELQAESMNVEADAMDLQEELMEVQAKMELKADDLVVDARKDRTPVETDESVWSQEVYDYHYVKQVVLFHKTLLLCRHKLDTCNGRSLQIRCIVFIVLIVFSVVASLFSRELPSVYRLQNLLVTLLIIFSVFVICACGELIASCNRDVVRAAYDSQWYRCASRTRRAVSLLMLFNQAPRYLMVFKIFRLDHDFMVRQLRMSWCVFNLVSTIRQIHK